MGRHFRRIEFPSAVYGTGPEPGPCREVGCYGERVDLTARVEGLNRQADSVAYKIKQDCECLRRTARYSRANREMKTALELERIANEREAEMASIDAALGR